MSSFVKKKKKKITYGVYPDYDPYQSKWYISQYYFDLLYHFPFQNLLLKPIFSQDGMVL